MSGGGLVSLSSIEQVLAPFPPVSPQNFNVATAPSAPPKVSPELRSVLKTVTAPPPTAEVQSRITATGAKKPQTVQFDVPKSPAPPPSRIHPKTIAFGRTVNVSQTVEAEHPAPPKRPIQHQRTIPMATANPAQNDQAELKHLSAKLEENVVDVADIRKQLCEVQANTKGTNEKLASTEQKLTTLTDEMHRMTELLKKLVTKMDPLVGDELTATRSKSPPSVAAKADNSNGVLCTSNKENELTTPDQLLAWLSKKAPNDEALCMELSRLAMQYGGDESLVEMSRQYKTGRDVNNDQSYFTSPGHDEQLSSTVQTMVTQRIIQHQEVTRKSVASPPRGLAALSVDSKRWLRDHGHGQCLSIDPNEQVAMNRRSPYGDGHRNGQEQNQCCNCHCNGQQHSPILADNTLNYGRNQGQIVRREPNRNFDDSRRYHHNETNNLPLDRTFTRQLTQPLPRRDQTTFHNPGEVQRREHEHTNRPNPTKSYVDNDRFPPLDEDDEDDEEEPEDNVEFGHHHYRGGDYQQVRGGNYRTGPSAGRNGTARRS